MQYKYQGNRVFIPPGAEVSRAFRPFPDAAFFDQVQSAIDGVEPWESGDLTAETFPISGTLAAQTALLEAHERPLWGVNPHHTAKNPDVSPFTHLRSDDPRWRVGFVTLELAGTVKKPILTRVYAGEYMPPLPWMKSAPKSIGGMNECTEYWQKHAFIVTNSRRPTTYVPDAPTWYQNER